MEAEGRPKKKIIKEIFLLRSIACLSVVLLHSIGIYRSGTDLMVSEFWDSIVLLLTFGTPTFIFISELLLGKSYGENVPDDFLKKRVKAVLIPYLFMAVFYGVFYSINRPNRLVENIFSNILGGYHGYFVLIIFQFYFLHMIFIKFFNNVSPKIVLSSTFVINVAYLAFFNLTDSPSTTEGIISYIWQRGYWLPFIGWIFYFALGFYCGKYYDTFIKKMLQHPVIIGIFPFIFGGGVLITHSVGEMPLSSKRFDMILFTVSMICLIYLIGLKMNSIPVFFITISQYSFGIYLLHMFYLSVMNKLIEFFPYDLGVLKLVILVIGSIALSMISVNILNRLPHGEFVAGKVGIGMKKTKKVLA